MTDTLTIEPPVADTDVACVLPEPHTVITWLHELAAMRREPAPPAGPEVVSIRDDVPANGRLFLSSQGTGFAMVFMGGPEFINRWYNWAVNCACVGPNAQLNWFLERGVGRLAYVCPRTRGDVFNALVAQFRWEIIRDREVPCLKDTIDPETEEPVIEYDERAIADLATARTEAFMRDHVRIDCTILARPKNLAPIYGLAGAGRAESRWATGTED